MPGLPAEAIPEAASGISFVRRFGGAVCVSIVGIFLEWRLRVHAAALPPAGFADAFWRVAAPAAATMLAAVRMRPPPMHVQAIDGFSCGSGSLLLPRFLSTGYEPVSSGSPCCGISRSSRAELRHLPCASRASERVTPPTSAPCMTKFSAPSSGSS